MDKRKTRTLKKMNTDRQLHTRYFRMWILIAEHQPRDVWAMIGTYINFN